MSNKRNKRKRRNCNYSKLLNNILKVLGIIGALKEILRDLDK